MQEYNLIIVSAPNHFDMVNRYKDLYFKYLPIKKIIVIGSIKGKKLFEDDSRVELLDEETLYAGLGMLQVRKLVEAQGGHMTRSNWYFQQFLKMAYSYCCEDEYYIVWDADTVPLRPIELFYGDKPLFSFCNDYRKDYFDTLETLFHGEVKKQKKESFIVEHMVIKTSYMREMIETIESDKTLKGTYFYEKIISSINRESIKTTGFSEFETYANYILTKHHNSYGLRRLEAFRFGLIITGDRLDDSMIKWLAKSKDTISFEHFCRPSMWRFMWLNEKTYQTKSVEEIWSAYEGSFYQKTDCIIKFILDKKDRIKYLCTRVPYRIEEYMKRKSEKNI